ncbi:MAG: aminotransferase class III-fold pyridoxal phosphate-dependent enzyme [Spirochaetaceae bacterium]|nr:MAG: aminotransferase class III-fold pyridoxal phosphate-dependent enzyme [Spirochaetaceae bacterium]
MVDVSRSIRDILGEDYLQRVCRARAVLDPLAAADCERIAGERVSFFPSSMRDRIDELLTRVGEQVAEPFTGGGEGAPSDSFREASSLGAAPVAGFGPLRIGEDGRLYFVSKSEHYHSSLGHAFPGYRLINHARTLGIPNATHNNTRGHIVRLLERELVRIINDVPHDDTSALESVLAAADGRTLNRVINLQTGSLAAEAALKMMLTRFYHADAAPATPRYAGRTPVIFVIADYAGGNQANYHGTTMFAQMMRGLWPEVARRIDDRGLLRVVPVRINDLEDFRSKLEQHDRGESKVAGFFHEIVLMNYGGVLLDRDYLHGAYALCRQHDVAVCVDEIQSCIWYEGLFLFKQYGLSPDFVAIGKGFSGGEYAGSRIVTTAAMDSLTQFGALVTNGQEELAALAYLVTMIFAEANRDHTRRIGALYEQRLRELQAKHHGSLTAIEGKGHLSTVFFERTQDAVRFCTLLNQRGIDISAHTYKPDCPPAALTKLPLITSEAGVEFLISRMDEALHELAVGYP